MDTGCFSLYSNMYSVVLRISIMQVKYRKRGMVIAFFIICIIKYNKFCNGILVVFCANIGMGTKFLCAFVCVTCMGTIKLKLVFQFFQEILFLFFQKKGSFISSLNETSSFILSHLFIMKSVSLFLAFIHPLIQKSNWARLLNFFIGAPFDQIRTKTDILGKCIKT